MPGHSETRHLPYPPDKMFDLVADVTRYAEFLPWVVGTRIKSRSEKEILADLLVGFGPLREKFTSRVKLERPDAIDVDYIEGPLKHLNNQWRFRPDGQGGSLIDFCVDFAFRNRMFEAIAGRFFDDAVHRMVNAFETRAKILYATADGAVASGKSSSSAQTAAR